MAIPIALKIIFLFLILFFLLVQVLFRLVRRFVKFPAPAFLGHVFDSSYRRKIQPPEQLIERSGIKAGMQVLEIGCGSGAFTPYVARALGEKGNVYALDIQPGMLAQLKRKLLKPEFRDVKNVKPILGNAHQLPFADNSLDLVYMVTVLQEIPDKKKALSEVKRVLKPDGTFAVTELLPDPDYPLKSTTVRMGEEAGFICDKTFGNFFNYTVLFIKK